jgi:hypothetical protein
MKNDQLCIKEDVCDMAVCDGVSICSHAVLKSTVLVQQSTNRDYTKCADEVLKVINYSSSSVHGRKIIEIIKWHFA